MNTADFQGRHYLITGAAGGIGSAVARELAAAGANLSLVDLQIGPIEALIAELAPLPGSAIALAADVSQADQVEAYVNAATQRYGAIDGFLNNAAIEGPSHSIVDYPVEAFERVLDVNVKGVWFGMKYVIPAMNETGGSIIITSSYAGVRGAPKLSGYITSKHAVVGIMRTAALELAGTNVRVNTVHPGMVDTDMAKRIAENSGLGEEAYSELVCRSNPLGRYAQPEDIVGMLCFLLSDAASYCNGSEYFVDGGIRAG
jgi:NAD(P)-dependent dehydrogenase (short-subunit alcohol dehydrogenase family)